MTMTNLGSNALLSHLQRVYKKAHLTRIH